MPSVRRGGMTPYLTPEASAGTRIDRQLAAAGWAVQDRRAMNLYASAGVTVREFPMMLGHGTVDYLLFVDGVAVGVVEAKKAGTPLTGVEPQSARYSTGLPNTLPTLVTPLPFLYESTGEEPSPTASIRSRGAVRSPRSTGRRRSRGGSGTGGRTPTAARSGRGCGGSVRSRRTACGGSR